MKSSATASSGELPAQRRSGRAEGEHVEGGRAERKQAEGEEGEEEVASM